MASRYWLAYSDSSKALTTFWLWSLRGFSGEEQGYCGENGKIFNYINWGGLQVLLSIVGLYCNLNFN